MINQFIQVFATLLNDGLSNLAVIVLVILSLMAGIDFVIAYIFEYSDNFSNIMKTFFNKIIRYGIFIVIAKSYPLIIDEITKLMFNIGYFFFPDGKVQSGTVGFPDFDGIYKTLLGGVLKLEQERNSLGYTEIGKQLVYLILIILAILCIFLIIKEIIVSYVEFRLVSAIGVILLPFNVLEFTKSIGGKLWNALFNAGARIMIAVSLTGICLKLLETNIYSGSDGGELSIGNGIAWIFMMGLCAYLISCSKELSSMLVNGTGSGNASAFGTALGMAVNTATGAVGGAVVGVSAMKGAINQGKSAAAGGKGIGGVLKAMRKGAKDGASVARNTRMAKIGRKVSGGLKNTAAYGTGQRSLSNLASDIWRGTGGLAGDQLMHDGDKVQRDKEDMNIDRLENDKIENYMGFERFREAIDRTKAEMKDDSKESLAELPKSKAERYTKAIKSFMKNYRSSDVKEAALTRAANKMKTNYNIKKTREGYEMARKNSKISGKKEFEYGGETRKVSDRWNDNIGKQILDNIKNRDGNRDGNTYKKDE